MVKEMAKFEPVDASQPKPDQPFVRIPLPADLINFDKEMALIKHTLSQGKMVIIPDYKADIPITGWNEECFKKLFLDLNWKIVVQDASLSYMSESILIVNTLDCGLRHKDRLHPHTTVTMGQLFKNGFNCKVCQNSLDNIQYLDSKPWFLR
jgi:hypothetical protein